MGYMQLPAGIRRGSRKQIKKSGGYAILSKGRPRRGASPRPPSRWLWEGKAVEKKRKGLAGFGQETALAQEGPLRCEASGGKPVPDVLTAIGEHAEKPTPKRSRNPGPGPSKLGTGPASRGICKAFPAAKKKRKKKIGPEIKNRLGLLFS